MDHETHGHVPYVVLLLFYLERWKESHDGKPPQNYREKSDFRDTVRKAARTNNAEGGEENFDEAVGAVLKNLNMPELSSAVKEVFKASECQKVTAESANFWLIANAISTFHSKHNVLPLPGSVPDMKAKSVDYIALQNTYKTKARSDFAEVTSIVRDLEKTFGRKPSIDEKEIEAFCKNAAHIKLVRGRPFHIIKPGERLVWGDRARYSVMKLTDPESLILVYIGFLAYDEFLATHATDGLKNVPRAPGAATSSASDTDVNVQGDVTKMTGIAHKIIDDLITEAGTFVEDPEYTEVKDNVGRVCHELVRAGGGEMHNISALAGGLVAQEVIKVITKQYVPVDNCCIFDGVQSRTSVLRF